MIKTWGLLGLAVCLEISGAIGLRFSEGFTLMVPTTIALLSFTLALFLVSRVMKKLPVSVAYPVWAGGGTAGVAFIGIVVLKEQKNIWKLIGVTFVIAGIIILNMASTGSGA